MSSTAFNATTAMASPTMFLWSMVLQCLTQVINPFNFVIGIFLLVLAHFSGFKCIEINFDDVSRYKKMAIVGTSTRNNSPSGVIFGKWFICWKSSGERGPPTATVFTLESLHRKVSKSQVEIVVKGKAPKTFKNHWQGGSFTDSFKCYNSVDITTDGERSFQKKIIDVIVDLYAKKNNAVVFISGPAGCGKSAVVRQLIRRFSKTLNYSCHLTSSFNPTTPGDIFQTWYTHVGAEEDSPFIVLMDEVDGILKLLGGQGIPQHPKLPIQIRNKNSWNSFFDNVDNGYYKNTIFILTSNLPLEEIDKIDMSFTRDGRVDARFEILDKLGKDMTTHLAPPRQKIIDSYSDESGRNRNDSKEPHKHR